MDTRRSKLPERRLSRRVAKFGQTGSGAASGGKAPQKAQRRQAREKAVTAIEQTAPRNPGIAVRNGPPQG